MSTETMYSKSLLLRRLDVTTHEEKKVRVQVTIELLCQSSPVHRRDLIVKLTSDVDFHFLFLLRITEDDFQSLKAQHGLLVDFNSFPGMLIDLLERARNEDDREVPAFVVQFVPNTVDSSKADSKAAKSFDNDDRFAMHFIETNQLQNLKRLSLRFVAARDAELKEHLAARLRCVTEEYGAAERRLTAERDELSQRLAETRNALSGSQTELERVRTELRTAVGDLQSKFAAERADERARHADERAALSARFETDRKELESAHVKIAKGLEAKLNEAETTNRQLNERTRKLESTVHELRSRVNSSEEELTRTRRELTDLRTENGQFDAELGDSEKHCNALQTRVAVLEQEARDKNALLLKTSELLKSEQDQKRKMEDDISRRAKQGEKLERSVKELSDELLKANEILRKMQSELRGAHGKIKLRNKIAVEQEKVIAEREKELEVLRDEQRRAISQLNEKESIVKRLTEQLENSLEKLNESKQLLKTNENVINWLNKQITEMQLAQTGVNTQQYRVRPLNASDSKANGDGKENGQPAALLASYAPAKTVTMGNSVAAPAFTFANRAGVAARGDAVSAPRLNELAFAAPKVAGESAQAKLTSEQPLSKSTALDSRYFQKAVQSANQSSSVASRLNALRGSIEANELAAAKKQTDAANNGLQNDVFSAYFPATAVGGANSTASS